VGGQETLAEKGGVDAVGVVAFAYDIYTAPSKNNGVLGATLTIEYQRGQEFIIDIFVFQSIEHP